MRTEMVVHVLLPGRLKVDGYGRGQFLDYDGTFLLTLDARSTINDVIRIMEIPQDKVEMTMLNGYMCEPSASLNPEDRVVLIPSDVAALWRLYSKHRNGCENSFDGLIEGGYQVADPIQQPAYLPVLCSVN
jgi:hypothetical protein